MKLRSITLRAAVAGATTALAAGALVAATVPANAATASTDYTCTSAFFEDTFPMNIDVPLLPPSAPAGYPIAQGQLSFSADLTIPAATAAFLPATVDGGQSDDYSVGFGSEGSVAAPIVFDERVDNEDGSVTFNGAGANEAFSTPAAGTYAVTMPASFTLVPTSGGTALPFEITCTSDAPGSLGDITLTKQASAATAKAVKAGKKYKVNVTVTNEYSTPTGKVVAKLGKKSFNATLKKGKATITLPKSAKGKKVTVTYKGDGFTQAAKTTVKVPKK
ncbi:hypothetical protein GCM10027062_26390 [Nocardioides hungaricus]